MLLALVPAGLPFGVGDSGDQGGRTAAEPPGQGRLPGAAGGMVARRGAIRERTRTINQARALVLTGPDDLRTRVRPAHPGRPGGRDHVAAARPGDVPGYATRVAVRELGRRAEFLDSQLERLDELIAPLVTAPPPACWPCTGSAPTPRRCCSSRRETIPDGSGPRPPGRTCARPPRSPHHRGKSPATGSTPAATARPTTPCGGSCSPGWAPTRPPAPRPSAARPKGNPRPRSSAA